MFILQLLGAMLYICYWHLSCLVFSELPGSMFWCLTLVWKNSQSLLFQIFLLFLSLFFSFWYSHYVYITTFVVVPQSLDVLFCLFFFLSVFIFFAFQFLKFLLIHSQTLSSAKSSLIVSPSRAFFISFRVFGVFVLLQYFYL